MNVLILGAGGREHVFAWKISQSKFLDKLYVAPGNGGTTEIATNVDLDQMNFAAVGQFCLEHKIDLLIPASEAPLVAGIVDYFIANNIPGLFVWGPSKAAAQLEGSKYFAKQFMDRWNIPTATYRKFNLDNQSSAIDYIKNHALPIVLKADGLAAGKGVLICNSVEEAIEEFEAMMMGKFGDAGASVVIESFLSGIEFSVFVLTDGESYQILPPAKDYKRIGEGDSGLNTGGMGSISPPPFVSNELMQKVRTRIIEPTIKGIKEAGLSYNGFIFLGLMVVQNDPYVIEYNVRMGDPETQSVFCRLENDLIELAIAAKNHQLHNVKIEEKPETAATVVTVSGGYPEKYTKGFEIAGVENTAEVLIFHAGTQKELGKLKTNGGRVLAVTALGADMRSALLKAYANLEKITYTDQYYRKDIGFDL